MQRKSYALWRDDAELSAGIDLAERLTANLSEDRIRALRNTIEEFCQTWFAAHQDPSGTLSIERNGVTEILAGDVVPSLAYLACQKDRAWISFLKSVGIQGDIALALFLLKLAGTVPTQGARWLMAKRVMLLQRLHASSQQQRRASTPRGTDELQRAIERILERDGPLTWKEVTIKLMEEPEVDSTDFDEARDDRQMLKALQEGRGFLGVIGPDGCGAAPDGTLPPFTWKEFGNVMLWSVPWWRDDQEPGVDPVQETKFSAIKDRVSKAKKKLKNRDNSP